MLAALLHTYAGLWVDHEFWRLHNRLLSISYTRLELTEQYGGYSKEVNTYLEKRLCDELKEKLGNDLNSAQMTFKKQLWKLTNNHARLETVSDKGMGGVLEEINRYVLEINPEAEEKHRFWSHHPFPEPTEHSYMSSGKVSWKECM